MTEKGLIQQGQFTNKDSTAWAIIYRHYAKDKMKMVTNLGDLLIHVPNRERLKWKKYFIRAELDSLAKLLFYDLKIPEERASYVHFWKERFDK